MKGRLLGLGVGPGDPELITLKALRLLQSAPVVGYFVAKAKASKGQGGNAFGIIEQHLTEAQRRLPLVYPVTTEKLEPPLTYESVISDFYDGASQELALHLEGFDDASRARLGELVIAALLAADVRLPTQKRGEEEGAGYQSLQISPPWDLDLARLTAEAEGNGLARHLAVLPASELNAQGYRAFVRQLAQEQGWQWQEFDEAALAKLGAGAFLPVAAIPYFGLVPLILGLRAAWSSWREYRDNDGDGDDSAAGKGAGNAVGVQSSPVSFARWVVLSLAAPGCASPDRSLLTSG